MPHIDRTGRLDFEGAPFQGRTSASRHASYTGAVHASRTRGEKQRIYAHLLKTRGPLNPAYQPRLFELVPKEILEKAFTTDPMRSHLHIAAFFLQKALSAKTCHFPKPWEGELKQLTEDLSKPPLPPPRPAPLILPLFVASVT